MAKVMIVDNEPLTVEVVDEILKDAGHTTITAYSGGECLKKLEKCKPDLVLLDIMMPDMSGWDVYQHIRKKHKDLQVAFLSVLEAPQKRKIKLRKMGLAGYITKPFARKELLKEVELIASMKKRKKKR